MLMTFVGEEHKILETASGPLKNIFFIGAESEQTFRYLGINVTQKQNFNITLDQIQFIPEIKSVEVPQERMNNK